MVSGSASHGKAVASLVVGICSIIVAFCINIRNIYYMFNYSRYSKVN